MEQDRVAGVPEVLAGHPHPPLRLRPRRRADHLQGVGLHQPRVRLQPPHRQRRDLLRTSDRPELQVDPRRLRRAAAEPPPVDLLPHDSHPHPRAIRRLGCAAADARHRARHPDGDRRPRGRRGARRALRRTACGDGRPGRRRARPQRRRRLGARPGAAPARGAGLGHGASGPGAPSCAKRWRALGAKRRACARWRPTAPGPASALAGGRAARHRRARAAPAADGARCSSACSTSSCRSSRSTGRPASTSETGIVHGAPRAELTVTFGGFRRGHLLARDEVGDVVVVDIGHPPADPGVADAGHRRRCRRSGCAASGAATTRATGAGWSSSAATPA